MRPADTAQVAEVVRRCAAAGRPIVAQGGNTGLVGGGVPRGGEVLLSLGRLDALGPVDTALGQVTAGAGVTLAALQEACRAAGLDAALDFAARDSATLGGIVACDAGGPRALRYGTARSRVVGVEAVLADGTVISRLDGPTKDNAGYDLSQLLVGSEGTLGVVTAVRWRAEPLLRRRVATLVPAESVEAAGGVLAALRTHAPSLESCDFLTDGALELVLGAQRRSSPLARRVPLYVLAECAADGDPTDELVAALGSAGALDDAVLADDGAGRAGLWRLRDGIADAVNALGVPHKIDVGVPLAELERFLAEVPGAVAGAAPGARTFLFGHLGDGNVHVNVVGPPPDDDRPDDAVLELALACGGTISAEHGVGAAKARWLPRARGAGQIAAMRAIKGALDPAGILNPGVVLPSPGEER